MTFAMVVERDRMRETEVILNLLCIPTPAQTLISRREATDAPLSTLVYAPRPRARTYNRVHVCLVRVERTGHGTIAIRSLDPP